MNYAVCKNGMVVNIAVWDGVTAWAPPDECVLVQLNPDEWCSIGAVYDPAGQPRFSMP